MSMPQMQPTASTALLGNANTQMATIVPNIQSAADNSQLIVESSITGLNNRQPLTLDNTFDSTYVSEQYATTITNGNVSITGALPGHVKAKDLMIEFGIQPQFAFANEYDGAKSMFLVSGGTNFNLNDETQFAKWIQRPFAMLEGLIQVQFSVGNNNQLLGRQQLTYNDGITFAAQAQKHTDNDIWTVAQAGLPKGRNIGYSFKGNATYPKNSAQTENTILPNNFFTGQSTIAEEWRRFWSATVKDMYKWWCLKQEFPSSYIEMRWAVPLRLICHALNMSYEDTYLPPGLKYRLQVQYKTDPQLIMQTINPVFDSSGAPNRDTLSMTFTNNIRLVFKHHVLTQSEQEAFNREWLTRPLLYQYRTFEAYDKTLTGSETVFNETIATSQQAPARIFIGIMYTGTSPSTLQFPITKFTRYNDTPDTQGGLTVYPNQPVPCLIENLYVNFNGRAILEYKRPIASSNSHHYNSVLPDANMLINNRINSVVMTNGNDKCYGEVNGYSLEEAGYFVVNLNTGDINQNRFYSTDRGAVTISVNATITTPWGTPFPVGYKLRIWKELPEQIRLDAAGNIEIVQWPAIVTQNSTSIVSTFNRN